MNIQNKTVPNIVTFDASYVMNTLNDQHHTIDDPASQTLTVSLSEALPPQSLVISGQDYVNLGQWTDATLNQYIITKLGLIPI